MNLVSPLNGVMALGVGIFFLLAACDEGDTWLDNQTCMGTDTPAELLSETGCFTGESLVPVDTLVSYEIQASLWSDGSAKRRYITLPKDAVLEFDAVGNVVLPPGGVLIKEFVFAGRRVETRFLSRDLEGEWQFSTYVWQEDDADARLLTEGTEVAVPDGMWMVPSLEECRTCHTEAAVLSVGLTLAQLNRTAPHPFTGVEANQLETLADVGWLLDVDGALAMAAAEPALAPPDSSASLESRARSYLHANCAFCHGRDEAGVAGLDLRYDVPASAMGVCNTPPEFGDFFVENARLLVPGDPEASLILLRMRTDLSSWRMPTLGSAVVDTLGVDLVGEWITEQGDCP